METNLMKNGLRLLGLVALLAAYFCRGDVVETNRVIYVTRVMVGAGTNSVCEIRSAGEGILELRGFCGGGPRYTNTIQWNKPLNETALGMQREFAREPKEFQIEDRVDPILARVFPSGPPYWCLEVRYVEGRIQQAYSITANTETILRFIRASPTTYALFNEISKDMPKDGQLVPPGSGPAPSTSPPK